jgi:hypothetical protein
LTSLRELIDLIRAIAWAIEHPLTALKRLGLYVGGTTVGCLSMALVFVAALGLGGLVGLEGDVAGIYTIGSLVAALLAALVVVRIFLRRVPADWHLPGEPARDGSMFATASRRTSDAAPRLAELDARFAPGGNPLPPPPAGPPDAGADDRL